MLVVGENEFDVVREIFFRRFERVRIRVEKLEF